MAGVAVLEKNEKRAFFDDTTPLTFSIITNRLVPKQNYVVSNSSCYIATGELPPIINETCFSSLLGVCNEGSARTCSGRLLGGEWLYLPRVLTQRDVDHTQQSKSCVERICHPQIAPGQC